MLLGFVMLIASSELEDELHQNYCNHSCEACDAQHGAATATQRRAAARRSSSVSKAGSGCFSSSISLWSVRESASAPSGSSGDCQSDDVRFLAGAVHARNLGDSGAAFSVFNEARARLWQNRKHGEPRAARRVVLLRSVSRRKRCVAGQQIQRQSLARLATEEL